MAKSLKAAGTDEIRDLKVRVLRQRALGRISTLDADWLVQKCDQIEVFIIEMQEIEPDRREF